MSAHRSKINAWLAGWRRMLARLMFVLLAFMAVDWTCTAVAHAATPAVQPAVQQPAATAYQLPCVIVPVTCIPGVPKLPGGSGIPGVGSILKIFNPFEWLNSALEDFRDRITQQFEQVLVHPIIPQKTGALMYLYGNSLGFARSTAVLIAAAIIVIAMFIQRYITSLIEALVMAVGALAILPYWFSFCDWMLSARTLFCEQLINLSQQAAQHNGWVIVSGNDSSIIGNIWAISLVLALGFPLLVVFIFEAVMIILAQFLVPILWVFYPLGDRAKTLLSTFASAAIVSMFLGAPVAILCIEFTQICEANINVQGPAGAIVDCVFTCVGFTAAIVFQFILYRSVKRGVLQRMKGSVNGESRVRGKVQTVKADKSRSTISAKANAANARSMQPQPVYLTSGPQQSRGQRLRQAAKSEALYQGATVVKKRIVAKGAASATGVGAMGVATLTAAEAVRNRHKGRSFTQGRSLRGGPPGPG